MQVNQGMPRKSSSATTTLALLSTAYAVVMMRTAWVNEDAYITLRTVDNLVNGYGLRWNISERVQTFTHPLWMLLMALVYAFSREDLYTITGLSIVISLGAFVVVLRGARKANLGVFAALTILLLSKAFVDYSTSGFENPLTHLLLALFIVMFLERSATDLASEKTMLALGCITGLLALSRMDAWLFVLPPLIWLFLRRPSLRAATQFVLGLSPFFVWEVFSILYYGFPFPNTAYAKLYTGVPRPDLIHQGVLYMFNSLSWDPITLMAAFLGVSLAAIRGSWNERAVACGIVLYLLYVVWIGGDYMSGRFLSGAVLASVILLVQHFGSLRLSESVLALAVIALVGTAQPPTTSTRVTVDTAAEAKIWDWRHNTFQARDLLSAAPDTPPNAWMEEGFELRASNTKVVVLGNVGYAGYFAGPGVHIVDQCAITDPLLARLRPYSMPRWAWEPGHFPRPIPEGYLATLRTGDDHFTDPRLGQYYRELSMIVSGPLFSSERLLAIWKMNTGQYDYLLEGMPVLSAENVGAYC